MSGQHIRTGVIGCGFVSKTFHIPMIRATSGLRLVAVSSSKPDRVEADLPGVAGHADPLALIARDDLDLVVIASPNDTHRPLAEAALAAGKHVLVDKPIALTLDEARSIFAAADRAGRIASVFQNRRWDGDYLGVKAMMESGRIGRVVHFESRVTRFAPEVGDQWRDSGDLGGGVWIDMGAHLVDQAVQLFGMPECVIAELAALRDGAKADDWFEVVLRYPSHRVSLVGSRIAAFNPARFVVHGDGGSVMKVGEDPQEDRFKEGIAPDAAGIGHDPDPLVLIDTAGRRDTLPTPDGDQLHFYHALVEAIAGRAPNPVQPRDALAVMAILEAARRSAGEGRAIPLDPDDAMMERLEGAVPA